MNVPLLDLRAQYATIRDEIQAAVLDVLERQAFILGDTVEACERDLAAYCDCRFGIGVSSGTDALLCALMAEGVGPGDEVITSPYTFFATAGCIARVGAIPRFVDIDPGTFNLRVDLVESAIGPRTRGVIPVHLYGQMAEMEPLAELCRRHNLWLLEDAAQAIGATYHGRRAGSVGKYGCFSFFPSKNLGAAGDGGLITTQDEQVAKRLRTFRNHGAEPKYFHDFVGGNFRLDAIQAAVIQIKLKYLDQWTACRVANAHAYDMLFRDAGLAPDLVTTPITLHSGDRHAHIFNQYVIRVPRRDALKQHLTEQGVGTEIYYPCPLHLQKCFAYLRHREGDFPAAERAASETLALPVYPELRPEQIGYVVDCIANFYHRNNLPTGRNGRCLLTAINS